MKRPFLLAVTALAVVGCGSVVQEPVGGVADGARVDYNRDVRPILSDRCFSCHGPDAAKRKAELRLDTPAGAIEATAGGVGRSELVRRITSADPKEVMPPPKLKRPLSDEERATLVRWVEQGAEYQPHWAFVAPRDQPPPRVRDAAWVRDELDHHVLARLDRSGLAPAPQADPALLLRRAALVLTGLPPTLEQADAFAADPSDEAYARAIDALLASPRAAEHMATTWLDLARFADTYGFQTDGEAFTWPWRDWLLRALRDNLPYDRFVTAIVAGDLAPDASLDERVATGFHRLHRMTEEGGSIAEEFRQEAIADRVSTFGTAFLGLTLECARCHDHKYDPLPTREFYALGAMFGALDENGLKPYALHVSAPAPYVRLATPEQQQRTAELRGKVSAARVDFETQRELAAERLEPLQLSAETFTAPPAVAHYAFELLEGGQTPNEIPGAKPATSDRHRPEQLGAVELGAGRTGRALHFDGDGGVWLDGLSGFGRHDEVSLSMWIRPGELNGRAALVHASGFYTQDADASGIELELDEGRVRWSAIHLWPGSAASIRTRAALATDDWTHLAVTYDGSSSAFGLRIYLDGVPADIEIVRDALDGPLAGHTLEVGSRSRGSGFRSGALDELRVWRTALSAREIRAVAQGDGVAGTPSESPEDAREHHVERVDEEVATARQKLRAAQRELAAHLDAIPTFMCMADSAWARPTYVLQRGAYDQPDTSTPIEPGALETVLPFDDSLPRNRAGLARWLLDPRNPLVARVEVNRLWAQVFGRGLVETQENFGVQGSSPTHPELLDALAYDFAHGDGTPGSAWNVRHMLRRLVLSATFRQASATSPRKRELDPGNALYSRGPATRMSAEMLRDSALCASGLQVEKLGGPSVRPWQPEGLWAEAGQNGSYQPDTGDNAHRRSLYSFRKRTVPIPNLSTFDAGARETCLPRRSVTSTPMQSLVLFNDPVYVECGRALALRVTDAAEGLDARIARAFRLVCTRAPSAEELAALRELVETASRRYGSDLGAAVELCGEADAQLAALTLACLTIFASDGALLVR